MLAVISNYQCVRDTHISVHTGKQNSSYIADMDAIR